MSDSSPLFPIAGEDPAFGLTARDFLSHSFKYWRTVLICVCLVTLIAWSAVLLQPTVYEASAKVWVQTEQQGTPSFLSGIAAYRESQVPDPVDRKIETEIQLLLSRSNVETVVQNLGITKAQLVQSPVAYFKEAMPSFLRSSKPKTAAQIQNDVVALFEKSISVEPMRSKAADTTSNVIEARFTCTDKTLAPRALAALMQQYLQFGAQHNRELGESTFKLVNSKIREETLELHTLDEEILQQTLRQKSPESVDSSGSDVEDSLISPSRGRTPSSLALLKSETIELQSRLEEAQALYTDESPNVKNLKEQLAKLQARLHVGVRATAELDVRLNQLERQRSFALERFTELRKKRDQIELYLQLNPVESDSRLVTETPLQPDNSKLKVKIVLALLGPFGGLFLGLVVAGFREYFDHRLYDAQDVRNYLGLETLGVVPEFGNHTPP